MKKHTTIAALLGAAAACGPAAEDGASYEAESVSPAFVSRADRWPTPTNIPVCWEGGGWSQEKQWVRAYVEQTYETLGDFKVDFTGWGQCSSGSQGIRIEIRDDTPRTTGLGTEIDGDTNGLRLNFQFASWSTSCAGPRNNRLFCIAAIAAHEFAHALSMAHEQNRHDTPEWCDQEQGSDGDTTVGPWDQQSITNYCSSNWNNDGILTDGDIAGLANMYAPPAPGRGKSVFYRDVAFDIHQLYWNNSQGWSKLNLSQAIGAPDAFGPPDAILHGQQVSVFYRGSLGTIHQLWWYPSLGWSHFPMSANINGAVWASGNPKGAHVQGYTHVFYRGNDNHIHQFFHSGASWSRHDLSAIAGAAPAAGDPAVYVMANSVHIAYRGTDNHIHVLEWEIDRGWRYTNLTGTFGGQQAIGNPEAINTGFFQHVFYRGTDNNLHQIWNDYMNGDNWIPVNLSTRTGAPAHVRSDPTVHVRSRWVNIFYRGSDNHVHEMFFDPQPGWVHNDLTNVTGGPQIVGQPISVRVGSAQHVFFPSWSGAVTEYYFSPQPGWNDFSLGAALGAAGMVGQVTAIMH